MRAARRETVSAVMRRLPWVMALTRVCDSAISFANWYPVIASARGTPHAGFQARLT